ncbi:DNA polymerase IV [Pseudonocardia spinosispora]|uniref:DNA polymerase IV n=1 Tax=Pseudonocardia spinosispora TaxID=103441 RepID=UPI00056D57DE|nr:DNA polymerase IV [Pseudonocardia spinosispora]
MRWVLHFDMDAFFASVEQLTRPTLTGRAVLVGGLGPRGVVAGASYEARVFGARSAMPMSRARRLVPSAVVMPPRGKLYQVLSERVFAIVREQGGVVEQVSLDEAFLEPVELAGAPPDEVHRAAEVLRTRIREATGLTSSVGAGSGKQLAKIASTMAKPNGVRVVPHGTERELLGPLPVRKLWGVGPVAEATLHRAGVETIGALAALRPVEVTMLLGNAMGTELHGLAQGIDRRPVAERGEAKQVSAETTFDTDLSDLTSVRRAVADMTEHAHRRLLTSGRAARTVTVKIRGADFATRSRSETTPTASTNLAALTATAQRLTEGALPDSGVRLIGVSLAGLTDFIQPELFEPDPDEAAVVSSEPALPVVEEAPVVVERGWRAGDDVQHPSFGHGWVQGSGHGRVTVRFETRLTGPGQARTLAADDPELARADPLGSLG